VYIRATERGGSGGDCGSSGGGGGGPGHDDEENDHGAAKHESHDEYKRDAEKVRDLTPLRFISLNDLNDQWEAVLRKVQPGYQGEARAVMDEVVGLLEIEGEVLCVGSMVRFWSVWACNICCPRGSRQPYVSELRARIHPHVGSPAARVDH
jgi:hypothetical protein